MGCYSILVRAFGGSTKENASSERKLSISFGFGASLLVLIVLVSPVRAQDDDGVKPVFRHCIPSVGVALRAAAEPDIGAIQPTVLVKAGTTVKLHGIAKRFQTTEQCKIESRLLEFRWSLRSIPTGKLPVDATFDLANDTTLNPSFFAKNPGTYVATLRSIEPSLRQSAEVRIEVLPPGRTWFPIGPNGETGSDGLDYLSTGRVNALRFDRNNPALIYASSGMGGLWRSNDRGASWFPLTDHKGLPTLSTGPIEEASDGTIYIGTGDLHPTSKPIIKGSGIWKSTDGGQNWKPAGTVLSGCSTGDVAFTGHATKIVSDPTNAAVIYVASEQGLFRSTNGGQCWTNLFSLPLVTDLQLDPNNPTTIYAAVPKQGLLKLTNASTIPTSSTTLFFPSPPLWSQVQIAPSAPNTIYVAYATSGTSGTLVKSIDSGESWPMQTNLPCEGCDVRMGLAVDPGDPSHILYADIGPHHSIDGGATFRDLPKDSSAHLDFHDLVFAPDDSRWAYAATDGGVFRLFMLDGGQHPPFRNWEARNFGLGVAQIGGLAAAPTNQSAASIGVWDNGTQRRLAGRIWSQFQGGDGSNVAFDANSESTIYYNFNALTNGDTRRLPDQQIMDDLGGYASNPYRGGELFGVALVSKADGKLYVLENSDTTNAPNWQCADPIPGEGPGVHYLEFHPGGSYFASYGDGSIVRFRLASPSPEIPNCATDKTAATGLENVYSQRTAGLPTMAIDPFNSRGLYVVILQSGGDRVLKLTKIGDTWGATAIDANLPRTKKLTRAVAADPSFRGLVYLGDENGLWEGLPDQTGSYQWTLNPTVPDTRVSNIVSHRNSNGFSRTVRLGTYGRGVWERMFVEPPCPAKFCLKQPGKLEFCLGCNEPLDPTTTTTSRQIDRTVWLTVNYEYTGSQQRGLVMRAAPLSNGIAQDFFISSTPVVEPGRHTAILQISYAGVKAPLSLHSEAIRVQIYDRYKQVVLTSRNFSLKNLWVRHEGRIITIGARAGQPGPGPVQTKVLVEVNGRTYGEYVTPTQLAFPTNARILVRAAPTPNKQESEEFGVWEVDDTERTTERTISIVLAQDVSLTAVYRPKRSVYQRNAEKKP